MPRHRKTVVQTVGQRVAVQMQEGGRRQEEKGEKETPQVAS